MHKKTVVALALLIVLALVVAIVEVYPKQNIGDEGNIAKPDVMLNDGDVTWSLIDSGAKAYGDSIFVHNDVVNGNLSNRASLMSWDKYDYSILLIQPNTDLPDEVNLHSEVLAYGAIIPAISINNTHGIVSLNETVFRTILFVNSHIEDSNMPEDVREAVRWMPHRSSEYVWSEIPTESGNLSEWCTGNEKVLFAGSDQGGELAGLVECILGVSDEVWPSLLGNVSSFNTIGNLGAHISSNNDSLTFLPIGMVNHESSGLKAVAFADNTMVQDGMEPYIPNPTEIRDMSYPGDFKVIIYGTGQRPVADEFHNFLLSEKSNREMCEINGFISPYD